jgi:hypothetical protein
MGANLQHAAEEAMNQIKAEYEKRIVKKAMGL